MGALASSQIFLFDDFRLDRCGGGLFRRDHSGAFASLPVGSRALDILEVLVARAGEVVSKDEIIAAVWPGTVVEDSNLTVQISALRRVLDHDRTNGSCIQTVSGRGYRFVSPVVYPVAEDRPLPSPADHDTQHFEAATPAALVPVLGDGRVRQRLSRSLLGAAGSTRRLAAIFAAGVQPRRRRSILAPGGAAVATVLVIAVVTWWFWPATRSPSIPPGVATAATTSVAQPLVAPRLSIVVLPFANLSNDPDQQYFADAITEDLTTDLSQIADMFVIARNTAFTYRNRAVNARQIGRELGVRFVLEGSVQRSANKVRITAQLVDAETNAHLWAERFDRDIGDLFAVQNEVTSRIAIALGAELVGVEASRPTDQPDAFDFILRGRAVHLKPFSPGNFAEAIGYFEGALALDPGSAEAAALLASNLVGRVLEAMTNTRDADIERAVKLADQALATSPRNPMAHYAKGQALRAQGRYAAAIPEYETAIAFQRNWVTAIGALADCKMIIGPIEDVIPLQEEALRLSPRDPYFSNLAQRIGIAHLLQLHIDEAIVWLEKARDTNPVRYAPHSLLASAYALKGERERAVQELAEARKLASDGRFSSISRLRAFGTPWGPNVLPLVQASYWEGLRKAGVPEE